MNKNNTTDINGKGGALISAILFDCDGVLVDSEPVLAKIASALLNTLGLQAKPSDFAKFIGTGEDRYLEGVIEQYGGIYNPELKKDLYALYSKNAPGRLKEVPGASALIRRLKTEGYKVAVASSADKQKVDVNLKALDLPIETYDAVITGSDVVRKKPWPDIYLKAAKAVGTAPERCIVIEDAAAGVESGKRGNMTTIAITTTLGESELCKAGADCVISSLSEILTILGID